jgi:pyruvate formate lyase activating enzyme
MVNEVTGLIFNIQRFSIHDGPGIRTTVFFKGCPLRCFWCHNPEGLCIKPEIQFFSTRCIACGECVTVCEQGAQELHDGPQGPLRIYHRELCVTCGRCVDTCYAGGLQMVGRRVSPEAVMDEILEDRTFYETSSGGVTLSGGEPMLQPEFAREILERCKAEGIHTAVETTAHCKWEYLTDLLPVTDLFMIDIKHADPEKHRVATGVSNTRILNNVKRLTGTGKPIIFRVPVVPTVNDTPQDIAAIAQLIKSLLGPRTRDNHADLELLPFHRLAGDKYTSLGLEYKANTLETPTKEKMAELVEVASGYGITVRSR